MNISALREEISERETVIAQNYTTIQLLRRRLADMEKHKFVLGYRTQVRAYLQPCACAQVQQSAYAPKIQPVMPSVRASRESSMSLSHAEVHHSDCHRF